MIIMNNRSDVENCRKNKYYLSSWVIWESVGQKWRRINVLKPVVKGVLGKCRIEMVTPGELRARRKKIIGMVNLGEGRQVLVTVGDLGDAKRRIIYL